jgi:trimethylamine-N-oxide reductase (cytochrome c)
MGDEDGVPKTPQWASELCGVPVCTIKALAREMASKITSIGHGGSQGGGCCRGPYSHETARMDVCLLAMMGIKPGIHQTQARKAWTAGVGAKTSPNTGQAASVSLIQDALDAAVGAEAVANANNNRQHFHQRDLAEAILNPPSYFWNPDEQEVKLTYPLPGKSEVHMLFFGGSSWRTFCTDTNNKFRAMQSPKIECIVSASLQLDEAPYYADIILPICMALEYDDIMGVNNVYGTLFIEDRCVKPKGEAKTDFGAILEISRKLGYMKILWAVMTTKKRYTRH